MDKMEIARQRALSGINKGLEEWKNETTVAGFKYCAHLTEEKKNRFLKRFRIKCRGLIFEKIKDDEYDAHYVGRNKKNEVIVEAIRWQLWAAILSEMNYDIYIGDKRQERQDIHKEDWDLLLTKVLQKK